MVRYGHRNEYGEIVETNTIPDLTWNTVAPQPKPRAWQCAKCQIKMILLPVSKDLAAEFWRCSKCSNEITIQQRDEVFEEIRQAIREKYLLKEFQYDKQNNIWTIQSAEWIGETRLDARRKPIPQDLREDLIDECKDALQHTLKIQIENIRDYFVE